MNVYEYEHTDTFSGEANYAWVKRGTVTMPDLTHYAKVNKTFRRELIRAVKAATNLTGLRCNVEEYADGYRIRPCGLNQVVFVNYKDIEA